MSRTGQQGLSDLDIDEIDNWLIYELQGEDNSLNNTHVPTDNNYNSEYNLKFRNDENQPFTSPDNHLPVTAVLSSSNSSINSASAMDSFSSELASAPDSVSSEFAFAADSLSSNFASTMVLATSNASSAISLPVRQLLHGKLTNKMKAEDRWDPRMNYSPKDSVVDQLTDEEKQKRLEKQERNKESARKSREKKKMEEEQLKMDNKRLQSKNEDLRNSVANLKIINNKFEEFFSNHPCAMFPLQDNGDRICVETGRNKVFGGAESDATENEILEETVQLMADFHIPVQYNQASELQRKRAILCQLNDDYRSEMVTSLTPYVPERGFTASFVNNTSIQETTLPDVSSNVATHGVFTTGEGAIGGKLLAGTEEVGPDTQIYNAESVGNTELMSHAESVGNIQLKSQRMPPVTGEMAKTTNYVPMVKQNKPNLSPWCTDDGNQSEENEALMLVQDIFPPPVKKPRLE